MLATWLIDITFLPKIPAALMIISGLIVAESFL